MAQKEYYLLKWDKSNKLHEILILFSVLFFGAWGGATLSRFPKRFHDFISGPYGTFMIVTINLIILDDFKVTKSSLFEIFIQAIIYTVFLQLVITYFEHQTLLEKEAEKEDLKETVVEEVAQMVIT